MNKFAIAIALCAALAACKRDDAKPAEAADAAVGTSGLPKECDTYINRAKACFAKTNPAIAAAFQKSLDESKAHWAATTDKATLATQCVDANKQFDQAAAAMKCE